MSDNGDGHARLDRAAGFAHATRSRGDERRSSDWRGLAAREAALEQFPVITWAEVLAMVAERKRLRGEA